MMPFARNRKGVPLQKVSLSWIIQAWQDIKPLTNLAADAKGFDAWLILVAAHGRLQDFLIGSIYSPKLRVAYDKTKKLFELLAAVIAKFDAQFTYVLEPHEGWQIKKASQDVETILLAELATMPVYLVTNKGPFDIDVLIDNGLTLFPPDMHKKVPESGVDAMEVGRCLAFERSTACGFHTFRATEAVLRRYWDEATNGKTRPTPQTLGNMAGQLEMCKCGDDKVIEALKQMTKLHRNPISHPDVVLTVDEAIGIIGMARSVITLMLPTLKDVPPTTGVALISAPSGQ